MKKQQITQLNNILNMSPGTWFVANVICMGIYEMVQHGVNHIGNPYAIVKLKKGFMRGFKDIGHETTCHPINIYTWNNLKIVKLPR